MNPRMMTEADFDQLCENVRRRDQDMIEPVRGGKPHGKLVPQATAHRLAPSLALSLLGPMVSGKNQVQLLFRKGKVQKYPNKTFTNWRARAYQQILEQVELTLLRHPLFDVAMHLTVDYWPADKRTRDITGMADALFHLLVYAKVLQDDGLIRGLVWREHDLNRKYPKLVMELRPL